VKGIKAHVRQPELVCARGAVGLARRRIHLDAAEQLARECLRSLTTGPTLPPAGQGTAPERKGVLAVLHDAVGQVLAAKGDDRGAEKAFLAALEADPWLGEAALHLGELHRGRGELDRADEFFVRALAASAGDTRSRSTAAITALYEQRHAGRQGLDAYLAAVSARTSAVREGLASNESIGASRPPGFTLERVQGGKTSLASLAGKYVVVAFWGLWCGACMAEMPELVRSYDHLRRVKDVAFVTINNDPNPEQVRDFLRKTKYDFDVLIDDGYAAGAGVDSFPSTWILDKKGRKAFEMKGYRSDRPLAEEIEARLAVLSHVATQ
jgi:thiol-disulfide isomerase/thioredoxin